MSRINKIHDLRIEKAIRLAKQLKKEQPNSFIGLQTIVRYDNQTTKGFALDSWSIDHYRASMSWEDKTKGKEHNRFRVLISQLNESRG